MSGWRRNITPRGGDRKALAKELGKARAMARILAAQLAEMRTKCEVLLRQADKLLCESWNERIWSEGEPIEPSPTIGQAFPSWKSTARGAKPEAGSISRL